MRDFHCVGLYPLHILRYSKTKRLKYLYKVCGEWLKNYIFATRKQNRHGCSSVGRALVSKTRCREFESLLPCVFSESWPSGRRRTPGKCVYAKSVSRVRIPHSPPIVIAKACRLSLTGFFVCYAW